MTFFRQFADILTLKRTPAAPTLQGFAKGYGGVKKLTQGDASARSVNLWFLYGDHHATLHLQKMPPGKYEP